ncbi:helix-turn-helix transcriptional regulator [Streptomyces sp. NPDC005251]|uniref:helix-turn-helix transcriptional regulator n=1 Tax=Streptomyces sp. NPDC005251 TaxID=3157166 RepID=UPI0033B7F9AF
MAGSARRRHLGRADGSGRRSRRDVEGAQAAGPAPDVRACRRGETVPAVSDRCAALGANIPRTVISNIENGRRTNVSVAEVLALASALGQAPAALVFPAGYVSELTSSPS